MNANSPLCSAQARNSKLCFSMSQICLDPCTHGIRIRVLEESCHTNPGIRPSSTCLISQGRRVSFSFFVLIVAVCVDKLLSDFIFFLLKVRLLFAFRYMTLFSLRISEKSTGDDSSRRRQPLVVRRVYFDDVTSQSRVVNK